MNDRVFVYTFRDAHFSPAGDAVVSAAPSDAVARVFGGGGIHQSGGLSETFGGAACFLDDASGARHLAVWGARNTAKFRSALRDAGLEIEAVESPPPGRLAWYGTR